MIVNNPAAERNSEAIFAVLRTELEVLAADKRRSGPGSLQVLEVASGPGQHVESFAARCPNVFWQPSEPDPLMRDSIDERVGLAGLLNVAPALALDVRDVWPNQAFDLVMAVNLLHISPWVATEALIANSAKVIGAAGVLLLYGPFREGGQHVSQGNIDFDASLRARDARWGIRDIEAVARLGEAHGLARLRVIEMPANNRTLLLSAS